MDEILIAWFILGIVFVVSGFSSPIIMSVLAFVFIPTAHFTGSWMISSLCSFAVYILIWYSIGHGIGTIIGSQTKK